MIVEQEKKAFPKITITIETEQEALCMWNSLNNPFANIEKWWLGEKNGSDCMVAHQMFRDFRKVFTPK